ncbi:hypothetical protein chiPu_0033897 [Chiloscyllium punctatum]|uniref:Uncharacterized protein n=1 Tax=Chiloscyllium punctatum TaxID=137246 RepID=A0A401U3P0_CHIPU|nr:hypothetical protein [Chiloscyllium punctatum]
MADFGGKYEFAHRSNILFRSGCLGGDVAERVQDAQQQHDRDVALARFYERNIALRHARPAGQFATRHTGIRPRAADSRAQLQQEITFGERCARRGRTYRSVDGGMIPGHDVPLYDCSSSTSGICCR